MIQLLLSFWNPGTVEPWNPNRDTRFHGSWNRGARTAAYGSTVEPWRTGVRFHGSTVKPWSPNRGAQTVAHGCTVQL